jgi:hypothetical protein
VSKSSYLAHTEPIFKTFGLLKIQDIRYFQISVFMFRFTSGSLPLRFQNYFQGVSEIHGHFTRGASNSALKIIFAKTNRRKRTIKITGPYIWNELPIYVKKSPSLPAFKYHLKNYILHKYINHLQIAT